MKKIKKDIENSIKNNDYWIVIPFCFVKGNLEHLKKILENTGYAGWIIHSGNLKR